MVKPSHAENRKKFLDILPPLLVFLQVNHQRHTTALHCLGSLPSTFVPLAGLVVFGSCFGLAALVHPAQPDVTLSRFPTILWHVKLSGDPTISRRASKTMPRE